MSGMLKFIKETINQKVCEIQYPVKPTVNPSTTQKNNIKNIVYKTNGNGNMCKPWNGTRLVVFDTETTGFKPYGGDEIISISGVAIENGEIRYDQIYDQLVDPCRHIPSEIEELTGITNDKVKGQPNVFEVVEQFLNFVDDAILVAHNADFDLAFLNIKLRRYCGIKIQNPVFDTCKVTKNLFSSLDSHSLDYLTEYFNLPCYGRHTSLGDTVITAQLFQNLKRILINMNINSLADLDLFMHHRAHV